MYFCVIYLILFSSIFFYKIAAMENNKLCNKVNLIQLITIMNANFIEMISDYILTHEYQNQLIKLKKS